MRTTFCILTFQIVFVCSVAIAEAYRTEDFNYANSDYLDALRPVEANHDGIIVLELVDPSNLTSTISVSFPTRMGAVVHRHKAAKHLGENPWGIALSTEADFEPRAVQKAKLLRETQELEVIFETWDIDDILAWGVMQETVFNFDHSRIKPADTLYVGLPLKRYNQSLMRKKPVTLREVIKRQKGEELLGSMFPEKRRQKFEKMKEELKTRLGVERFVLTPITQISQSEKCVYDYAVGSPPNPFSYRLANVTVYGTCVFSGIEFAVLRTTFHDAESSQEDLAATLISSMNYIEEILQNTTIRRYLSE